MAKLLKLRRGTTSQHGSFTGAEGEVTVDTDKETLVVHDGSTAGGHPVAAEDMANVSSASIAGRLSNDSIATSKIAAGALPSDVTVASANIVDGTIVSGDIADGTIVNADINASAAIAGTKISPDFGSQTVASGQVNVTSTNPKVRLIDSNNSPSYSIRNNDGTFEVYDDNAPGARLTIDDAKIVSTLNHDFNSGIDVTGSITATGTITSSDITIQDSQPRLYFNDNAGSPHDPDYLLQVDSGIFRIFDSTNNANRLLINTDGHIDIDGNLDLGAGVDVTGNITVAADGTKLDGIESGATGDQSNAEIRAAVEAASDSNVFTDADHSKLDGIETGATGDQTSAEIKALLASNNLTSAHLGVDSVTSSELADNAVDTDAIANSAVTLAKIQNIIEGRILGRPNGSGTGVANSLTAGEVRTIINVEDGATADQTGSEIAAAIDGQNVYTTQKIGRNSSDYIQWSPNTHIDVYINGSNEFRFEADGDFHADGDLIAFSNTVSSDRNLKDNIEVIPNALDKVQALNGVNFTWKRDGTPSAGVIAQEVQGVLPEAVKEVTPVKGGDSYLAVNYNALTSILIESIKELKAEIEELKGGK